LYGVAVVDGEAIARSEVHPTRLAILAGTK
jgi:hypothetical protein